MMRLTVIFLIIFLEGYAVLSTELLAIRQLIPFTGNGTDTVSVIIAAVLMPLAFGYFAGGNFRPGGEKRETVRRRLLRNLPVAAVILALGLSHSVIELVLDTVFDFTSWYNRIFLASVYSLLFLVYPVYLLGQTVPLVSNYFSRERLPVMAGRIMFFSTMGSFAGSVFCTLVLMAFAGVHNAVIATIAALTLLTLILSRRRFSWPPVVALAALAIAVFLNNGAAMKRLNIVNDNIYNTAQIDDDTLQNIRILRLNNTYSSGIDTASAKPLFPYFKFTEDYFIEPLKDGGAPHDILVIGAGGFALGRTDTQNNYTYVDVDPDLKDIAENLFLKEKLGPNKKISTLEARAFLNRSKDKYDLVILDIFQGPSLSPEHLVTREFFQQVKDHIKDGGAMVGNYVGSSSFQDPFSQKLENTMRSVFPLMGRHLFGPVLSHGTGASDWNNVGYYYIHRPGASRTVYTDDENRSFYDKPSLLAR